MKDDPVIQRMKGLLEAWEETRDRRVIFLKCYAMMTSNMLSAIQNGMFEDNAWVYKLLQRFAQYYFVALEAFEQHQTTPQVWLLAFNAARIPQVHVLQNLFLGVNAHINYDLIFSLTDVLEPDWFRLNSEQRQSRYRDHCSVNEIIVQTVDSVQDEVIERYEPRMDQIDKILGSLDEWITSRLIAEWREDVWQSACKMLQLSQVADKKQFAQEIERRALEKANALLGNSGLLGLRTLI